MKYSFKLIGIISLMAVIGLTMVVCGGGAGGNPDTGPGNTVLEGTWTADGGRVATFTGNNFVYKVNGETRYSGTFSLSGSTITFTVQGQTATATFLVSGSILTLSGHSPDSSVDGIYTKGGLTQNPPWTWSAYDDRYNGGNSTITMSEDAGTLTFSGELKIGYAHPYAGFFATPNADMLALLKTAGSIKFDFKGDGKEYRFMLVTNDIEDFRYYSYLFTPSANTWETITIDVSQLAQPDWGEGYTDKSFDQNQVRCVQWETAGQIGTFSVSIKNLTLLDSSGDASVAFSGLSADGSSTQTTTLLALTFSQPIDGLTADDITLSGVPNAPSVPGAPGLPGIPGLGIPGLSKGTLSGSNPYFLPISGFTVGGTLTVSVSKPDYAISGSPKSIPIYYSPPGILTITGVPQNLVNNVSSWGGSVGIFPAGTTLPQAQEWTNIQAGAGFENATTIQTGSTYTVTVTLIDAQGFSTPWTGSGSYRVFVVIGASDTTGTVYGANVSFSGGSATVAFGSAQNLGTVEMVGTNPPPPPPPPPNIAETPVISAEPASGIYIQNDPAESLSVIAMINEGDLSYQWYSNTTSSNVGGDPIYGETESSFTPSTAELGDTYYYVVVTNTDNTKGITSASCTSNVALIRVEATVVIGEPDATITVNTAAQYQYVQGFGGMSNNWTSPALNNTDIDKLYGEEGLGLNILRVMIYPYMDDLFNGVEPGPANDPNAHARYYDVVSRAKSRGAKILASPWTPPAEWKSNGSRDGNGSLLLEHWEDYANHLKDYIARMATNNAAIDYISIQNEPSIPLSYDGCVWSPEEICDFVKQYARDIAPAGGSVKIMPGEPHNLDSTYYSAIYNDADALAAIDLIGGHLYGSAPGGATQIINTAKTEGKEVWMTEYNINSGTTGLYHIDSQWEKVWLLAKNVHDCMVNDFSAYIWWTAKRFYSFIGDGEYGTVDGQLQFRGYAMSHYAKYAAGKTRVAANFAMTSGYNPDVFVTAYESDDEITLVLFNQGDTDVGQLHIALPEEATSASMVITTSNFRMAPGIIVLSADKKTGVLDLPASSIISVRFTK